MRKQLFYISNQALAAYAWQGGVLSRLADFSNDEAGRTDFGAFLATLEARPSYLLIDVVEEDFQSDSAPHVTGRRRKALVERKLSTLYRETPFRHAETQGRDPSGRRDDRYLFSALTKPEMVKAWLVLMQQHAVPVAGIYSLASFGQVLFNRLALPGSDGPVQLVSHQSSGLRQSFFDAGRLRFSRLTPLPGNDLDHLAETFQAETAKTRQFMTSTRLLARGRKVQVVVLASQETLAVLDEQMVDTAEVQYQAVSLEQARATINVAQFDCESNADPLYLALLASARLPSHFQLRNQSHFHQLFQARRLLYGASGAMLLGAALFAAYDANRIATLRSDTVKHQQATAAYEARFAALVKTMPNTTIAPQDMKAVVDLERMTARHVPLPSTHMAVLSGALAGVPEIRINNLKWEAVDPASAPAEDGSVMAADPAGDFPPPPALLGIPEQTSQTMLVEGEIVPFTGNYRAAIDSVARLAAALNRINGVTATVTVEPLDTRPTVRLADVADSQAGAAQAPFAIKVTWKPSPWK